MHFYENFVFIIVFTDHDKQPDHTCGEGCRWGRLPVSNLHWERWLRFDTISSNQNYPNQKLKPFATINCGEFIFILECSIRSRLSKSEIKPLTNFPMFILSRRSPIGSRAQAASKWLILLKLSTLRARQITSGREERAKKQTIKDIYLNEGDPKNMAKYI